MICNVGVRLALVSIERFIIVSVFLGCVALKEAEIIREFSNLM